MRSMYESLKKSGRSYMPKGISVKAKGERNPKNNLLAADITSQNQFSKKLK